MKRKSRIGQCLAATICFLGAAAMAAPQPVEARRGRRRGVKVKKRSRKARVSRRAKRRAKKYFSRAEKKFNRGQFQTALKLYTKAHKAWPLPAFLYNMGVCHSKLGNHQLAAQNYREFLRLSTNKARRPVVQAALQKSLKVIQAKRAKEQRRLKELAAEKRAAARIRALEAKKVRLEKERLEKERLEKERRRERPRRAAVVDLRLPPRPVSRRAGVSLAGTVPPLAKKQAPLYKKWWFWTVVAAVVVAAGVGAGVGVGLQKTEMVLPSGSLGTYDRR